MMYGSSEPGGVIQAARVFESGAGARPQNPTCTEVGAIERNLRNLEEGIVGAHARLDALTTRLTVVLKPPVPATAGPGANQTMGSPCMDSPCGETIRGHIVATEALINRINDLIDRIDL